jgi:hypothetical protein
MSVAIGDIVIAVTSADPKIPCAKVYRGWLVGRTDSVRWEGGRTVETAEFVVLVQTVAGEAHTIIAPHVFVMDGTLARVAAGLPDLAPNPFAGRIILPQSWPHDAPTLDGRQLRRGEELDGHYTNAEGKGCTMRVRVLCENYRWSLVDAGAGRAPLSADDIASCTFERVAIPVAAPQDVA